MLTPYKTHSFANIFSHLASRLFSLLMVSFTVQKLLCLTNSYLFISAIDSITEETDPKKLLLRQILKSILPMFSSRSFMVSGLIIMSLIHFEFIFVYSVRNAPVSFYWQFPLLCRSLLVCWSPLYFCFYFPWLKICIQKILLWPVSKTVQPMFSSGSFIVSGLTFKF